MTNFFQSAPAKNQTETKELVKIVEHQMNRCAVLLKKDVPLVKKIDSKVSLISVVDANSSFLYYICTKICGCSNYRNKNLLSIMCET